MSSIEERVATLEEKAENQEKLLTSIDATLTSISNNLAKQKGFIGGVIFAVSAIWVAAIAALSYFKGS